MTEVTQPSEPLTDLVATATSAVSGVFFQSNELTVEADGTLHLSVEGLLARNETTKVPEEQIRPLQEALARPEWQRVAPFYGRPVLRGYSSYQIVGGGAGTLVMHGLGESIELPPIVEEVREHLGRLSEAFHLSPERAGPQEARSGRPEWVVPNYFALTGPGMEITYGTLRARREFLDYKDDQGTRAFSGEEGEILALQTPAGRMLTVTLVDNPDSHTISLSLILPQVYLTGQDNTFETFAIRTTNHSVLRTPSGPVWPRVEQSYEVAPLTGVARAAD